MTNKKIVFILMNIDPMIFRKHNWKEISTPPQGVYVDRVHAYNHNGFSERTKTKIVTIRRKDVPVIKDGYRAYIIQPAFEVYYNSPIYRRLAKEDCGEVK